MGWKEIQQVPPGGHQVKISILSLQKWLEKCQSRALKLATSRHGDDAGQELRGAQGMEGLEAEACMMWFTPLNVSISW